MTPNYPWAGRDPQEIRLEIGGREYVLLEGGGAGPWNMRLWPSCVWLAHELATMSLQGRTICDVGAGLGLLGMVAASLGAKVYWLDNDPRTCDRIRESANKNGLTGTVLQMNWEQCSDVFDLAVGSEVLYSAYAPLGDFLSRQRSYLIANHRCRAAYTIEGARKDLPTTTSDGGKVECDLWSKI